MRRLLRVVTLPLPALILLAALAPCVCAPPVASAIGEHGCCAPAGIHAVARPGDCCSSMREAVPGLSAAGHDLVGPVPTALPRPAAAPASAPLCPSRSVDVAASPPCVLRI